MTYQMKKFVAVIVALSMLLTMALAMADETTISTYIMTAAADAEGNVVSIEEAQLPILVLAIDGASDACAFGTEEELVEGTYEIVVGDDDVLVLYVTLTTDEEIVMFYVPDEDAWMLVDEESGISMYLFNIESIEELAA